MGARIKLLPSKHHNDLMYLTIKGNSQGLISSGASTPESIGNFYKHGHEDEIMVTQCDYGGSNPTYENSGRPIGQSHSDAIMMSKMVDKSSPLLHNAMTNGELLSLVRLTCYKTSRLGWPEHYYTITLRNAKVVVMDTFMKYETNLLSEHLYFSYEEMVVEHELANTMSQNYWQHSTDLHKQRMQVLGNDVNGYNDLMSSLEKRRQWHKAHPHHGANKMANFWVIASAPFGAYAVGSGAVRAGWWAYRNPVIIHNFVQGAVTQTPNLMINAQRYGYATRKVLDALH